MKLKKTKGRSYKINSDTKDSGEENWLVSYADLMTLLFGFFVILTVFSTPDPRKLEKLRQQTAKSLNVEYVNSLSELSKKLKDILKEKNLKNIAKIELLTDGIQITGQSRSFFDSGSAMLLGDSELFLGSIASTLKNQIRQYNVIVEGHTDDIPIKTVRYPSNWELSLRRASEVVRLFERKGVPHNSLRPIGLSDTKPFIDISKLPEEKKTKARALNRRIVIKIQRKLR